MRIRDESRAAESLVGVLDVGTSKVCCLIAAQEAGGLRLLGLGHQRSEGLKAGVVVDADEAEQAVRSAVSQAERMAGVTLARVWVAVACGRIRSQNFIARAAIEGTIATEADMARVLAGGEAFVGRGGRTLVQLTRSGWRLDGVGGVRDPSGMAGSELAAELHAVTADEAPLRNMLLVVERCYLEAAGLIATPYASALAATSEEERHLGVLVADLGAGTTTLAVFADGHFVHTDALPVGGNHITYDIARFLSTPLAEAERIKTLYGSLAAAHSDECEIFSFPVTGEAEASLYQTSKARLRSVIAPRVEALLGLVEERLERSGLAVIARTRVVLTGGASQLIGLEGAWAGRFGGVVRVARPQPIGGMPTSVCSPAFSTVVGLALAAVAPDAGARGMGEGALAGDGYLGRMHRWIRESF